MPSYHVFIERPREVGAAAVTRLAEAVAERYGLPAPKLIERLAAGRIRVKANIDRAAADALSADLERLGAVCSLVDSDTGATITVAPAAPAPRAKPATSSSGLSAASSAAASQDLGALWTSEFSLSTLDGKADSAMERDADERAADELPASFAPPSAMAMPASIGPAITPSLLAKDRRGTGPSPAVPAAPAAPAAPIDLFAPPDAGAPPPELVLQTDSRDRRAGTTAPAPAPKPAAAPAGTVAAEPEVTTTTSRGGLADWIRDGRVRLATGVALAILLGFVPATVVASLREGAQFERIDAEVALHYKGVQTLDDYQKLDGWLDAQRANKRDVQHSIAIGSMLIWALAGAAVAFVWFRKIDWDRVADRFDA